MAKTVAPGAFSIPGVGNFVANAVPDLFDKRDLEYRPRLEPLAPTLDQRSNPIVLLQEGNSCTGHALATAINTILADSLPHATTESTSSSTPASPLVSPYMLYYLARRYDEFDGEEDTGSSLRGGFKGWFNHGVALESDWPHLVMAAEPDVDSDDFKVKCRDRPLGAFYRVNPYRLDDMQSAINELKVIVVSSVIHDGWLQPTKVQKDGKTMYVIARRVNSQILGGHAFALVGYNEVGFLVQNSWGDQWGRGGFATLPYEDWLDSAYDAWVARPGVPKTPFANGRNASALATQNVLSTSAAPDLRRLAFHVVNLGNDGLLSTNGKFVSTPAQIDGIFEHMETWHDWWLTQKPNLQRHIVLYAHGGLDSESVGLAIADKHLNWWLNNRIYPISFAWQSGAIETLLDQIADTLKGNIPFGGIGFDLVEQFDRLVERTVRTSFRWAWEQMKQNARGASDKIPAAVSVQWPPAVSAPAMAQLPGASLTVTRLARYIKKWGAPNVALHLVAHSAGAVFHAPLLERLEDAGISVSSMSLLAPAIRVDDWASQVLPHLQANAGGKAHVQRFSIFGLSAQRELDDIVGTSNITPYHKSLLYLVSRGFEGSTGSDGGEVPLLGMQKFFDRPFAPDAQQTLRQTIMGLQDSAIVFARSESPADQRSNSRSHGGMDDDASTMTSVAMRALRVTDSRQVKAYQENANIDSDVTPPSEQRLSAPVRQSVHAGKREQVQVEGQSFEPVVATHSPGGKLVTETTEPQSEQPVAPPSSMKLVPEVADAPRSGSSIIDILESEGWTLTKNSPNGANKNHAVIRRGKKS